MLFLVLLTLLAAPDGDGPAEEVVDLLAGREDFLEVDGKIWLLEDLFYEALVSLEQQGHPAPRLIVFEKVDGNLHTLYEKTLKSETLHVSPWRTFSHIFPFASTESTSLEIDKRYADLLEFSKKVYGSRAQEALQVLKFFEVKDLREELDSAAELGFTHHYHLLKDQIFSFESHFIDENHQAPDDTNENADEPREPLFAKVEGLDLIFKTMAEIAFSSSTAIFVASKKAHRIEAFEEESELFYLLTLAEELGHVLDRGAYKNATHAKGELEALQAAYGNPERALDWNEVMAEKMPSFQLLAQLNQMSANSLKQELRQRWNLALPYLLKEVEIRGKWFAVQYLKKVRKKSLLEILSAQAEGIIQVLDANYHSKEADTNHAASHEASGVVDRSLNDQASWARILSVFPPIVQAYYRELYDAQEPPVWLNPYWKRIVSGSPIQGRGLHVSKNPL